jgi:hypothetical protein
MERFAFQNQGILSLLEVKEDHFAFLNIKE